jgi:hypothetical protein
MDKLFTNGRRALARLSEEKTEKEKGEKGVREKGVRWQCQQLN